MEIWKDIPGYEGYYQVSNKGNVKSVERIIHCGLNHSVVRHINEFIMKPYNGNSGYLTVILQRNGKNRLWLIHRLVALTFIDNPGGLECVNHKDENKLNNSVENLEWCTNGYNTTYSREKNCVI